MGVVLHGRPVALVHHGRVVETGQLEVEVPHCYVVVEGQLHGLVCGYLCEQVRAAEGLQPVDPLLEGYPADPLLGAGLAELALPGRLVYRVLLEANLLADTPHRLGQEVDPNPITERPLLEPGQRVSQLDRALHLRLAECEPFEAARQGLDELVDGGDPVVVELVGELEKAGLAAGLFEFV
jgi:hypothetical protein